MGTINYDNFKKSMNYISKYISGLKKMNLEIQFLL